MVRNGPVALLNSKYGGRWERIVNLNLRHVRVDAHVQSLSAGTRLRSRRCRAEVVAEHATHLHAAVLQVALNAPAEGFARELSLSMERRIVVVVRAGRPRFRRSCWVREST